jgi:hypothetical protein
LNRTNKNTFNYTIDLQILILEFLNLGRKTTPKPYLLNWHFAPQRIATFGGLTTTPLIEKKQGN